MGKMLLAVHLKKTDAVDLKHPMLAYINATYSQGQANEAVDDLGAVQGMRSTVTSMTGSLPSLQDTLVKCAPAPARALAGVACRTAGRASCSLRCVSLPEMHRVRAQVLPRPGNDRDTLPHRAGPGPGATALLLPLRTLCTCSAASCSMGACLPLPCPRQPASAAQVRIAFTWYDAFKSHKRVEAYSLHLERAAVMFNVGAVLTQQALAADASTSAGMLECAKKFQVCPKACTGLVVAMRLARLAPAWCMPPTTPALGPVCGRRPCVAWLITWQLPTCGGLPCRRRRACSACSGTGRRSRWSPRGRPT